MEIKSGLNLSTNGEALLDIKGLDESYQVTMNYLVKSVESEVDTGMYPGILRLTLTFTPSNGHSNVQVLDYENPKRKHNRPHIQVGDYIKTKRGKVLQVQDVDVDERIDDDYLVAERAGYPMIMRDGKKSIRNGLQYRVRAKTADLYKLAGKREPMRETFLY